MSITDNQAAAATAPPVWADAARVLLATDDPTDLVGRDFFEWRRLMGDSEVEAMIRHIAQERMEVAVAIWPAVQDRLMSTGRAYANLMQDVAAMVETVTPDLLRLLAGAPLQLRQMVLLRPGYVTNPGTAQVNDWWHWRVPEMDLLLNVFFDRYLQIDGASLFVHDAIVRFKLVDPVLMFGSVARYGWGLLARGNVRADECERAWWLADQATCWLELAGIDVCETAQLFIPEGVEVSQ